VEQNCAGLHDRPDPVVFDEDFGVGLGVVVMETGVLALTHLIHFETDVP
jgi:hypothetical protein